MGPLHARMSVKTSKLWLIYEIAFECATVYIATAAIATYIASYVYLRISTTKRMYEYTGYIHIL